MARLKCSYRKVHQAAKKKIGEGYRTDEWQYEVFLDGKFQFKVSVPDSHGQDTAALSPGTLQNIRRALKLDRAEFINWVNCPIDREDYERLLRERLPR